MFRFKLARVRLKFRQGLQGFGQALLSAIKSRFTLFIPNYKPFFLFNQTYIFILSFLFPAMGRVIIPTILSAQLKGVQDVLKGICH